MKNKIIRKAYEYAEKFVEKVDSWKARSKETYSDMKELIKDIEILEDNLNNEIIKSDSNKLLNNKSSRYILSKMWIKFLEDWNYLYYWNI